MNAARAGLLMIVFACGFTACSPPYSAHPLGRTTFIGHAVASDRRVRSIAVSANGDRIAYISGDAQTEACGSVYVYDVTKRTSRCASPNPRMSGQSTAAFEVAISADGRHVAWVAWNAKKDAPNIEVGNEELDNCDGLGNDRCADIFVHDVTTQLTTVVSAYPNARLAPASSGVSISGDGRFVAFASGATVFLRDRDVDGDGVFDEGGQTTTTVVAEGGGPALSADGRVIAFSVTLGNTSGPYGLGSQVVVQDRATGRRSTVGTGIEPSLSADGRLVAFTALAEGTGGVYVHDLATRKTTLISHPEPGVSPTQTFLPAERTRISHNGRFVTFISALRLTAGARNACPESRFVTPLVYVRDLVRDVTALISISPDGRCADGTSYEAVVGDDGSVAFLSSSENLTEKDDHGGYGGFYLWRPRSND